MFGMCRRNVGRGPVPRYAKIAGDRPPRYIQTGQDQAILTYREYGGPCRLRSPDRNLQDPAILNYRVCVEIPKVWKTLMSIEPPRQRGEKVR